MSGRRRPVDSVTFARVETYLEEYGALIPTSNYAVMLRIIAGEMRNRGQYDAGNYLDRAANVMEQ